MINQNNKDEYNCILSGFAEDRRIKRDNLDIFSEGFFAGRKGDSISFKVKATEIAIQYKKTISRPAPIANKRWSELIRRVSVKTGDFVMIEPGTIHAITAGLEILETQQNSNITYRVYDYDRMYQGSLRTLHVDKSLDVIYRIGGVGVR